jgi:hypothetical protein
VHRCSPSTKAHRSSHDVDDTPISNEPKQDIVPENKPRIVTFKVYFPNNYSGIKDGYKNALEYLYHGKDKRPSP